MKKVVLLSLLASAAIFTNASAENFSAAKSNYKTAVVNSPATATGTKTYRVTGDMVINNELDATGTGDYRVGGNLYVNAPFNFTGTGNIIVNGDLVIKNRLAMTGTGSIIVAGKIVIIEGAGNLINTGTGDVKGDVINVAAYMPAAAPVQVQSIAPQPAKAVHITTIRPQPATTVIDASGVRTGTTVINSNGVFTDTTSVTPGGIVVHQ